MSSGEVDRLAAAGPGFERVELVGEDRAAVEQEPADQRALAVVDRARREEAQRPARDRDRQLRAMR